MKSSVMIGVFVGAVGAAGSIACSSTSSGGGGTGGYGTVGGGGGAGGSSAGGMGSGGMGGMGTGGMGTGGMGSGGMSTGGASSGGTGSGTGGGSSVTLPAGCASGLKIECNPVDGKGCNVSGGATCDLAEDKATGTPLITCFDPPNTQKLGETCNNSAGPYCAAGMRCDGGGDAGGGTCKKFCCATSDCGGSGTCTAFDAKIGTLGVCM